MQPPLNLVLLTCYSLHCGINLLLLAFDVVDIHCHVAFSVSCRSWLFGSFRRRYNHGHAIVAVLSSYSTVVISFLGLLDVIFRGVLYRCCGVLC